MKAKSYGAFALGALLLLGAQTYLHAESGNAAVPAAAPAVAADAAQPAPVAPVEAPAAAPVVPKAQPQSAGVKPAAVEVPTENTTTLGMNKLDDDTINVSLDAVPVSDVVRMFAQMSKANIVAASLPGTNVTVRLEHVRWEPALSEILGTVGLALVEHTTGIYTVVPKEEIGAEPVKSDIIFLNYTTSSNVLPLVSQMVLGMTNSSVAGYSGANALIVRATESNLKNIKEIITRLDKPRDQVMIECKFVELNDEAIKDIGINWQSLQGWSVGIQAPKLDYSKTRTRRNSNNIDNKARDVALDSAVNTKQNSGLQSSSEQSGSQNGKTESTKWGSDPLPTYSTTENNSTTASKNNSSLSSQNSQQFSLNGKNITDYDPTTGKVTFNPVKDNLNEAINSVQNETIHALSAVLTADAFQATLSALQQNNGVEIVSNPKIVVASGQTAMIHVGRNEPNVVATQIPNGSGSQQTTYQLDQAKPFIELGVILYVTPVLNTSNNISIKIKPELSRKLSDLAVGSFGQTFPVTETRKVDTEFTIESGRTVALGGLTQNSEQEVVSKIPILGDIPLIGKYLFRHTHTEKLQDEVIIFVTASSSQPDKMQEVSGIPEDAKLIHRHLAKKIDEASKAEELAKKKATKATLPK